MVCKIHKTRTQDHLGNHQATWKVAEKPVITPWITEQLEYLFLQSSSRIQHARTKSRGWSRSSRTTSIKNHSFRTWDRRRISTSLAENRKTWSPTWTTPRSSNFAKILPISNVLTAMPVGKWEKFIAAVEEVWSLRGVQRNSTRSTLTSPQSLDTWSIKTEAVEPSTELLKDKRCTTMRSKYLKRSDRESTEAILPYFRDGTPVHRTETRCVPSGGEKNT